MDNLKKIGSFINSFMAQAADYGFFYALRHSYNVKLSPGYQRIMEKEAPSWLAGKVWRTTGGLSVHMLLCSRDLTMGMCAMGSLLEVYGQNISVNFHDDGSLTAAHAQRLKKCFPDAKIHMRREVDGLINKRLSGAPLSIELRRQCVMLVKFFDPLILGSGERRLLIDSDVIFFRRPDQIIDIVNSGVRCNYFNRDLVSSYCIDSCEASRLLGRPLVDCLNAGLALIHFDSIDLSKCDQYLSKCNFIERPWVLEQTLQAMFSSVFGVDYLSDKYELTASRFASADAVTKHYVGRMTEMFFLDGFRRMK
jgi:hypothetical protein